MMDESFVMILPSDSCMDSYPTNTVQRFRVHIPARLNFDENWTVALQSIIYPKSQTTPTSTFVSSASPDSLPQPNSVFSPNREPTNNAGDHMWIYSDCVQPLLVGDRYHSVLSICPFSTQGIFMPTNLLYMPVQQGDCQSISVWCANHIGEPYPFDKTGRLILVLHFKRQFWKCFVHHNDSGTIPTLERRISGAQAFDSTQSSGQWSQEVFRFFKIIYFLLPPNIRSNYLWICSTVALYFHQSTRTLWNHW